MYQHITNFNELPDFQEFARNKNEVTSNSSDLDLMIIDISTRERKQNSSDNGSGPNQVEDDMDFYLAKELLEMNKNPLMMKSLFLPDKEDVFFNNFDRMNLESDTLISDESIIQKTAPENKFRGEFKRS